MGEGLENGNGSVLFCLSGVYILTLAILTYKLCAVARTLNNLCVWQQFGMLHNEGASYRDTPHEGASAELFAKGHPGRVWAVGFGLWPPHLRTYASGRCGGTPSSCSRGPGASKFQQIEGELKGSRALFSVYQGQVSYFTKQWLVGVAPSESPIGWEIGTTDSIWLSSLLVKLS